MAKTPSFIKKGREGLTDSGGGQKFLKLKDGDSAEIAPIGGVDDIISFDQHAFWLDAGNSPIFPCLQSDDCPGCMLGHGPSFKALMSVVVRGEEGPEERMIVFGKSVFKALIDAEDALGSLNGNILKYSRKGSGMATRYTIIPTGRKADVPSLDKREFDPIDHVGLTDRDEIIKALTEAGLWPPKAAKKAKVEADDEEEAPTPKKKKPAAAPLS